MRVLCVFVVLFLLSSQVQAQPPVKQYEMGFETVEVFEYIKSLREANQPVPIFPSRTSNALIVKTVADKSRASMAGLQENDLIHIVNGSHLRAPRAGDKKLSRITSQDELKLGVIRREENRWNRISVVLPAISDETALRLKLRKTPGLDSELLPVVKVRHRESPATIFAPDNFQLYFTETNSRPAQLHLRMAQLLPGKTVGGTFIIATEHGQTAFETEDGFDRDHKPSIYRRSKSPEWEPIQVELQLLLSEEGQRKIKEEFRVAEEAYEREFKDFKFDEKRTDKAFQERNKERLKQIAAMERINAELMRVEQNHQRLLRRQEQLANPASISGRNSRQLTEQSRKAIRALYTGLTPEQQEIVRKVFLFYRSPGVLNETGLLQLEETGFAEWEIKLKRASQGWKWYDAPVNQQQLKLLRDIISADNVTVHHARVPGQKFTVSAAQREQMKIVLDVFFEQGGKVQ